MTTFTSDLSTAKQTANLPVVGSIGFGETTGVNHIYNETWRYLMPMPTYVYPSTITVTGVSRPDSDSIKLAASVIKRLLTKEALEKFSKEERDELKLALAVLSKE